MKKHFNFFFLTVILTACTNMNGDETDNADPSAISVGEAISSNSESDITGQDIFLARLSEEVGMPEALMSGRITVEDSCVVFNSGGQSLLAILPQDAHLDASGSTILSLTGNIRLDQELKFGGGIIPKGNEIFSKLVSRPPGNCPEDGAIIGAIQ